MREVRGNLWTYPADVRVITTNGTVKKDGSCVMGRGCALEAKKRWPGVDGLLGEMIHESGNVPHVLGDLYTNEDGADFFLVSFPVKHQWFEKADTKLIEQSALLLHRLIERKHGWDTIVMPRSGCGNGGLRWEDVRPVIAPILDDRFHVITF